MKLLNKFVTLPLMLFVSVNLFPPITKGESIQGELNTE